ncbi:50S ribosomal protein L16 [Candidatus Lucifugimonas marina]|uniref:Large ribosomal subunit protein uL16 n=1 Tax=Candidatus Lucifugimonas marina TaxID=3038979 RepID=A0AAJ6CVK6_9CHLR|nr:50S ribosomal protein L16 [SAR202 cluster bacterium JH702]MDG0870092.1 50S ribosomal protein L16 [SAR202 cluster bacterium JH639]WFG36346.1 50S ribosomal protein L16 [SAR202 cluster bacterium JH545]WFG40279.1 50S ribosomal protein L16 [SAR202 cluster bacterium JH1073]
MLQPKRTKFRKEHRGRMNGIRTKGSTLVYGDFGLKATGPGWVTAREIEAARRAITGYVKRGGQVWVRLFPDKPVSARPAETRMGGGKGAVDRWVAVVIRGRMLYEMADVPEELAREALRRAAHKLNIPTKIVARSDEF